VWSDVGVGAGNIFIGVGTNSKYYIYLGGTYNDITPIVQTSTLTNPITTSSGSSTVTITDATYNPNIGDYLLISGATAVGGITLSGEYVVTSVISTTQYTVTASTTASSNAIGGGTVTIKYELPTGQNFYTFGNGWAQVLGMQAHLLILGCMAGEQHIQAQELDSSFVYGLMITMAQIL
jgi:hypothetical protein